MLPVRLNAGLPELHTLRLSSNIFRDTSRPSFFPGVPGPLCSTLQRLEMRGCFLRSVPHFVSHLTALTALDLSGNRTLEVSRSDAELFSRLTALRDLVRRAGWTRAGESGGEGAVQVARSHICMNIHSLPGTN